FSVSSSLRVGGLKPPEVTMAGDPIDEYVRSVLRRAKVESAERKKAALHKSKQAAIEKYGAVMVAAAERGGGHRLPPNLSIDPYGSLIACYRATYWTAMTRKEAKLPKVKQLRTRRPVPKLDLACTVRAIERMHGAPSRPFVGAYLLEACRDEV